VTEQDAPAADAATLAAAGLRLEQAGPVATVTLARPERRNAMTPSTWLGLAAIGAQLPSSVRVVVIRGDGPSFCAGIDVRMFAGGLPGEPAADPDAPGFEDQVAAWQEGYLWLRRPEIVSVAAVQGHAIGAGAQLALACDLRILADDAQLCIKEAALGLVPDLTGTKPLVDILGLPRALELCLTARTVLAAEACELRLAELAVPRDELDRATGDLVAALLAADADAARSVKRLLQQAAAGATLTEQARAERQAQRPLLAALLKRAQAASSG
jgi:enoyl-CoA hydratase/carnithine racemase